MEVYDKDRTWGTILLAWETLASNSNVAAWLVTAVRNSFYSEAHNYCRTIEIRIY